ncbi:MAG TPA: glycosyltransferase family 2 protein [Gaiellaceae bacterium]|nr:glycosyltransferase family 2 protein [Gaiellaceae bacterium]
MAEHLTAEASRPSASRPRRLRTLAIVPAYNEDGSLGQVLEEIRAADPDLQVVVINDASTDATADIAGRAGVSVVHLPFNVGIGGAMQTGYQYARDHGFEVAMQIDSDGQHDAAEAHKLLEPLARGEADMVIGTRFAGVGDYRSTPGRRIGMVMFSGVARMLVNLKITDPTSGFRAVNRHGIELFARDYPHDFPEVESNVLAARHGLRIMEVPVKMRERAAGESSVTTIRGTYFVIRIMLSLFISVFRRYPKTVEDR